MNGVFSNAKYGDEKGGQGLSDYSPNYLMMGREATTPLDIGYDMDVQSKPMLKLNGLGYVKR